MHLTRKHVIVTSLTVVVLCAALVLGFPPLARHLAVQKLAEATGRRTEIAAITFNPFTLSAGISGLRLSEKGGTGTFLSFSSARVSLSPLSLPKRAFIVSEAKIVSPYFHLVRNAPNSFNFSDLLTEKKEQKKEGGYLFSLNNITVSNGSLDFQDKALAVEKDHQLRKLALSVPFFSNIPYLADRYVTPHFSAVVNGTPVAVDGRLKPLSRALETSIDLKVQALDLPFYLGYVPVPLPVRVDSGKLTTALVLGYRVDAKTGPEVTLTGTLALDRVALRGQDGTPLTRLESAKLAIRHAGLLTKEFDLTSLDVDGLDVVATRDASGKWNFQKLAANKEEKAVKSAPNEKKADGKSHPLSLQLAKLTFKGGKVHLADAVPKGGFRTDLNDIDLDLTGFSTATGRRAPFDLKLASARGETVALKGELVADPLEVKVNLALAGVPLKDYYPYLSDTLTAPVSGTLGVNSDILYSAAKGLVLEKTSLKGEKLAAKFGKNEGILLKEVLLSGIDVDLNQKKALVENIEFKGGSLSLSRDPNGAISAQQLLKPQKAAQAPAVQHPAKTARGKAPGAAPFSYRIGKISASDLGIKFTDRAKEDAPSFALSHTKFTIAGISGPHQGPIPFTLAAGYGKKGQLAAAGSVLPTPLKLKGNLKLKAIALRDFDAYIPEGTQIFLADGALSTNLTYNLENGKAGLTGSFGGSLGVHSFYCLDTILDEDLLKWDSLELDRISGTLAPFSLGIRDVSLSNFYARVIVEKDGTLNLQHLSRQEPAATVAAQPGTQAPAVAAAPTPPARRQAAAPPAGQAAPPAPGAASQIRIDTVALQGGTLDFSDRHLKTPFETTFYNLGGRVSGLSSETNRAADVDLRGNLENHSPLSITGQVNPLRGDLFLDLKIAFTDIELSPFTPYSNTYLGYTVDKGKLNLDLAYKIDKKALSSSNKLFIDQFTFGKAVQSDKATKLPVRLAIALLKDRKGEIHLNLPVAGQTDDPKFSVWGVVMQMLKNLLVKAATSPFALLGSLFGGGEDFSAVTFDPGSSRLTKADEGKLLKLAKLLEERPALNLEISGFVDREKDAEGYRNELLVKKMKGEKFRAQVKEGKTREGQTQEETELSPQEYPVYLKAVYAKEKFPKPRNILGIAKDLPDAEMKKLILTHTVVGDHELQMLARERAEAVRDYLLKNGKLPPQRLFEKNTDIFKAAAKEGTGASRVEFGAMVK